MNKMFVVREHDFCIAMEIIDFEIWTLFLSRCEVAYSWLNFSSGRITQKSIADPGSVIIQDS